MFLKKIIFIFMILVLSVFGSENAKSAVPVDFRNTTWLGAISLLDDGTNTNTGVVPQQLHVCFRKGYEYLYQDEECSNLFSRLISVPSTPGFAGYFKGDTQIIDESGYLAVSTNRFASGTFCGTDNGNVVCSGLVASYQSGCNLDTNVFAKVMLNSNYDGTKSPQKSATPNTLYLKYGVGFYKELTADSGGNCTVGENEKTVTILDQPSNSPVSSPIPVAKAGYKFKGFYTQQNGSGHQIINSAGRVNESTLKNKITSNSGLASSSGVITLYADWVTPIYTITLNKNGGTGGDDYLYAVPGLGVYSDEYGSFINYNVNLPTRSGYVFDGYWSKQESGYLFIDTLAYEQHSYTGQGEITQFLDQEAEDATGAFSIYARWTKCETGQYVKDNMCIACGAGSYMSGNECLPCPNVKDGNDNDAIGNNTLYTFNSSSTNKGITSCAITLNINKSACGDGTEVIYTWSGTKEEGNYVRKRNYSIVEGNKSVMVKTFPSENITSASDLIDYCKPCENSNEYNINGVCGICNKGNCLKNNSCMACPAGQDCSAVSGNSDSGNWTCPNENEHICPINTFSEEGYKSCVECNVGYSTVGSESCSDKENGTGCRSYKACVAIPAKICFNSGCSKNLYEVIKGISFNEVNMSVVKSSKTKE